MLNVEPYVSPFAGGALMGLSASLVYLLHGRSTGIAGLFGGLFLPGQDARSLRLAFIVGLAGAGIALSRVYPSAFPARERRSPARHHRRSLGRLRDSTRWRLYEWSRDLWHLPALASVRRRHTHIHGCRHGRRLRGAPHPRRRAMMRFSMLALGALFGVGLAISGMTRPEKVMDFLDVFGRWDPAMMFVMMGAMAVHFGFLRLLGKRARPIFDEKFHLPSAQRVDRKLVVGAAVFGVGWGLGGFCPGPALVTAGTGGFTAFIFVAAMAAGMTLNHFVTGKR